MKNEYRITKKLMMSWANEYYLPNAANIIAFVLWCIIGIMGLGLLGILIAIGGKWTTWYMAILFLVLSVYKLFFSRFVFMSNRYKMLSKTYGVDEWIRTAEFADDEIILSDHTSITKFKYSNIEKIKEKNNTVMIFFNDNLSMRLYKDAFVEGTWEECKEMINSKIK